MRIFFDENLSHRLVPLLSDLYPGSVHVRDVGLVGVSDETIWEYARENTFLIVSKDADFYQRSVLRGAPPKVVWLQVGNASTTMIANLLRASYEVIHKFYRDPDAAFLVLRGVREANRRHHEPL